LKLLIVEDNPEMRRLLRRILGDLADEITECSDGLEVVALYTHLQPDWVLMDIEMKQMDGIRATRQLKTVFPGARVLIVTSYEDHILRETAHQAGASGYVLKENLLTLRHLLTVKD
jgi:CheY-like chemotaxis protein